MNKEIPIRESQFNRFFRHCNGLDEKGFHSWFFYPGMLFHETEKWWGEGGIRVTPHEGIDFCFFRDNNGKPGSVNAGAKVPVVFEGMICSIADDFLGKSIFICHNYYDQNERQLISIYGHVEPCRNISPGSVVREGEVIALIGDASKRNQEMPSHVHISLAWIRKDLPDETLNWEIMKDNKSVVLFDPFDIIVL